jgi:hypothetical protein
LFPPKYTQNFLPQCLLINASQNLCANVFATADSTLKFQMFRLARQRVNVEPLAQ